MTIDEIPELETIGSSQSSNYLMMIKKPLVGDVFVSYKASIGSLSNWFLLTDELKSIQNSISKFQENIGTMFTGFVQEESLEGGDYMLKEDADVKRKKLLTDERMDAILEDYITKEQLSVDLKEVEENACILVNSYVANVMGPAASIKNGLVDEKGLDNISEKVADINSD